VTVWSGRIGVKVWFGAGLMWKQLWIFGFPTGRRISLLVDSSQLLKLDFPPWSPVSNNLSRLTQVHRSRLRSCRKSVGQSSGRNARSLRQLCPRVTDPQRNRQVQITADASNCPCCMHAFLERLWASHPSVEVQVSERKLETWGLKLKLRSLFWRCLIDFRGKCSCLTPILFIHSTVRTQRFDSLLDCPVTTLVYLNACRLLTVPFYSFLISFEPLTSWN
jgi:hypothetical protein